METLIEPFIKLTSINLLRYFIFAGAAFLFYYKLFPKSVQHLKIQLKNASNADFLREVGHSIQTTFVFGAMAAFVLFGPLRSYSLIYEDPNKYTVFWIPISVFIAQVLHDTYFYWMHRLMHHPSIYKYTHLVHHKSTNPSPWTSYSFHLVEAILEGGIIFVIAFALPMHTISIKLFIFSGFLVNVYGHLGYEIIPSSLRHTWFFKWVNTSVYHNMHHSHFKGNYSLYFRWWDKWMGTEHPDYEKYFDKVVARRNEREVVPAKKSMMASWKKIIPMMLLLFILSRSDAQIVGKWKMEHRDAVIEILEENGTYFGRVIDAGNMLENAVLKYKEVKIFYNFKQCTSKLWCCGTMYQPYKNLYGSGNIELLSQNRIRISGNAKGKTEVYYCRKLT